LFTLKIFTLPLEGARLVVRFITHELSVTISLVIDWGKFINFTIPKDVKNVIIIVPEDFDCNIRSQIKSVRRDLSVIVMKLPEIKGKLYVLY
jgi:hypothetical protein